MILTSRPRLYRLADRLFREARQDARAELSHVGKGASGPRHRDPLLHADWAQNLAALTFDQHIFLNDHVRGTSSLELAPDEVKNDEPIAFDIPDTLVRNVATLPGSGLRPKIVGHRPKRLFVNVDGSPKCQEAISDLVIRYARRRAGVVLDPTPIPTSEAPN